MSFQESSYKTRAKIQILKKIDKLDMAAIDLLILKNGMEDPPLLEPFQGVLSPLAYFLETALIFWAP